MPDLIVAFVPITPIFCFEYFFATSETTGSITLITEVLVEMSLIVFSATDEAELHAITIILQFFLIKKLIILLLKICIALFDFSP